MKWICKNCEDYEKGIEQISAQAQFCNIHSGGPKYTFKTFVYCPFCGSRLEMLFDAEQRIKQEVTNMHDDKYNLIGVSEEDMWKQDESKNGDAIIAIDESGYGHMIVMLTTDDNKIRLQSEYDILPEMEYHNTVPGLYYANMQLRPVYEEVEIDWEIVKPLYQIIMGGVCKNEMFFKE